MKKSALNMKAERAELEHFWNKVLVIGMAAYLILAFGSIYFKHCYGIDVFGYFPLLSMFVPCVCILGRERGRKTQTIIWEVRCRKPAYENYRLSYFQIIRYLSFKDKFKFMDLMKTIRKTTVHWGGDFDDPRFDEAAKYYAKACERYMIAKDR